MGAVGTAPGVVVVVGGLVLLGECPPAYAWAEDLYRRLGPPGRFQRLGSLAEWRAETDGR